MLSALRIPKGKDRFETAENYSMAGVVAGAVLFSLGVGLAAFSPAGVPAVLAMIGAVASFVSSVALVFSWLAKDLFGSED
ncbi:MAG: hypothetical protein ABIA12_01850 [Candidatus Aenigmatarchaeota archaeon]